MRILIVDDDPDSTRSLVGLLHQLGHDETRTVVSAAAALASAVELLPHFVFMAVELPEMSGYDAALLMHRHPQLERTRLMALTDHSEHPGRDRARTSGFERYLVKPVTVEALQEVLAAQSP
jgi:CheY-like chemotaxis protein